MNIKLYAETYLSEVAGMVFVDSSHEEGAEKSFELQPEAAKKYALYLSSLQDCLKAKPSDFIAGSKLQQTCGVSPNSSRFSDAINALQRERVTRPGYMGAWISEYDNVYSVSADQLRAAHRSLGDIPIIVLTHEPLPRQEDETQEMRDAQNRIRTEMHTEIAAMSTRGTLRTVRNSGHFFQLDQPQEVSAAILEVLHEASGEQAPRTGR
jgi:pimeloyl-ACP methyl ester carboxylesterase